jgi:hypothetical protein
VFLAGDALTHATWSEASAAFYAHKGQYRSQHKPETDPQLQGRATGPPQVVFERQYCRLELTDTRHFAIFKAPGIQAARSFLLQPENRITQRNRTIRVETPDGTICRDADGIYELDGGDRSDRNY